MDVSCIKKELMIARKLLEIRRTDIFINFLTQIKKKEKKRMFQ